MAVVFTSENFENEVLKSDIPVLVDFYADWCVPCKMMAPILEELVEPYQGRVKIGKINVDESQAISEKYSIMTIPTFMLFKDGEILDRVSAGLPKAQLEDFIKKAL